MFRVHRAHGAAVRLQGSTSAKSQKRKTEKGFGCRLRRNQRPSTRPVSAYLQASGVISAKRKVTLMSQRAGRIVRVSAEEGDVVKNGQSLGQLDNERETILLPAPHCNSNASPKKNLVSKNWWQKRYKAKRPSKTSTTPWKRRPWRLTRPKNLRETQLRAPFTGVVVKRHWETGATANPAAPAFVLSDFSRLEVRLGIPEDDWQTLRKHNASKFIPWRRPPKHSPVKFCAFIPQSTRKVAPLRSSSP